MWDLIVSVPDHCLSFYSTTHQDHFTHSELKSIVRWAKMGGPKEKTPAHPQAELGLSHM